MFFNNNIIIYLNFSKLGNSCSSLYHLCCKNRIYHGNFEYNLQIENKFHNLKSIIQSIFYLIQLDS